MPAATTWLKEAAIDSYITLCSRDGRRLRAVDADFGRRCRPRDDETHLRAALRWLCRAHDVGTDDGLSAMYSLVEGWLGSYPEVTGYVIPTLFDAAERLDDRQLADRAVEMADWLLTRQLPDGAFPGSFVGRLTGPRVFNTGQAIFGLIQTAHETGEVGYLEAAVRSGTWLVSVQDDDGAWRRFTLNGVPHAYNARTAWALARLAEVTGETRFRDAAVRNATWTVGQQCETGWFKHNTFTTDCKTATLHTLSYCTRGLLEVGACVERRGWPVDGDDDFLASALRAATALLHVRRQSEQLAGSFRSDWSSPSPWRCIPGEAQLAIVWMRLGQLRDDSQCAAAGAELIEQVKAAQLIDPDRADLDGAVSGSLPINAPYERYCLVSWGPKFLIDALILKGRAHGQYLYG